MGFKVGQRVAYSILQTYAEYSAVPAAKLQPVPDNCGLDVATACVVQGMTAHYLITDAHAQVCALLPASASLRLPCCMVLECPWLC